MNCRVHEQLHDPSISASVPPPVVWYHCFHVSSRGQVQKEAEGSPDADMLSVTPCGNLFAGSSSPYTTVLVSAIPGAGVRGGHGGVFLLHSA